MKFSARFARTSIYAWGIATVLLGRTPAWAQSSGITSYCNPLDIDYRYNFEQAKKKISYRSAADPVIVNHKGDFFLFATISNGWWHSKDLIQWDFVSPSMWPIADNCAPAALSVRDTIYLFQSTFDQRPVFFTTSPETGELAFFNELMPQMPGALGPWDPAVFHDSDTDRWFMYFGSSNLYPIYGIELDHSRKLIYQGTAKPLLSLRPDLHGWERFGQDHRDTTKPFIEGAWMTKHGGKYYLQYAAPGTEYNVYANGTYVGDSMLGPFTYAPYNPFSYKPGGFVAGAGHGNTFRDNYGNYWNTGTPWVAVNWNFERRIAMFPAGFDGDGELYADTRFGDFPHHVPTSPWKNTDELFTGWMLLSYRKPCTASSFRDTFVATNVTDENPRTFWVARDNQAGEWLTIDLGRDYEVRAVQVNFTDYQSNIFFTDSTVYTQFRVFASMDARRWVVIADLGEEKRDRPNAYIELTQPLRSRYIRYKHITAAAPHLAISDIRVFGKGYGSPPTAPPGLMVRRDADPRNAFVTWQKVEGAVGYNVRWGIHRGKLRQTYQVFADRPPALEVRALTVGQGYYFAIEAFDENGVSELTDLVACP